MKPTHLPRVSAPFLPREKSRLQRRASRERMSAGAYVARLALERLAQLEAKEKKSRA